MFRSTYLCGSYNFLLVYMRYRWRLKLLCIRIVQYITEINSIFFVCVSCFSIKLNSCDCIFVAVVVVVVVYCQNAVILMPALCSLFTVPPLPGDWWCRNGLAGDSIALDERWSRVAWCIALLPCNVFALLSNCCGGEWLSGWFCRPASERTCSKRPLFNSRAWCSCALARRHAIELFLRIEEKEIIFV